MTNVPGAFKAFHDKLRLGKAQEDRIDSAWATLVSKLVEHYELPDGGVFLQGSYPNGTAIRPNPETDDGEYDVDLICVSAGQGVSPEDALGELEGALVDLGYKNKIEPGPQRPCVRLRYADDPSGDKFHVDVTPARACHEAPLEIPLPGSGWHPTDPAAYTAWCQNLGDPFGRTVQMLKRWRDCNQTTRSAIKSILLQVLIHNHLDQDPQDGDRITSTLTTLSDYLAENSSVPRVENPVLPTENLAERWKQSDYEDFKECLADSVQIANEAMAAATEADSCAKWRELFGKDFPDSGSGGSGSLPVAPKPAPGTSKPLKKAPRVNEWAR